MSSMTSINCTINERPSIHERPREMSRGRGLDSSPASRHDRPVVSDSGPHRTVRNQSEANGGEALMRALYAEHAGPLLAFVLRLTRGDRQRAEDIVQETLLRAWRNADLLRDWEETSPRPWLVTVARRIAIDGYRSENSRPLETFDRALDSPGGGPDANERGARTET